MSEQPESTLLAGRRILPPPITAGMSAVELIEGAFLAYNGRRLREACRLFAQKMLDPTVTVGVTLAGALTPAGLGLAALAPLIEAGFIDWIVSTGANLYHDTHFALAMPLREGTAEVSDIALRQENVIRIYDIFFHYDVLLSTDAFYRELIASPEFNRPMSTAEFHHLVGKYLAERERLLGGEARSLLATAYRCGVPIYTSSPGDSSIGMNVAALSLDGSNLRFDTSADVNETAAIVLDAKRHGGKSGVLILGGGSPKNFILQTEPHIQEVLGIDERGHDYFLQVTDARPDTGGLSGATPSEAVSWGKIDPDQLADSIVCYVDSTVALPLLTAYALGARAPRPLKRLYDRRDQLLATLQAEYLHAKAVRDERAHAADRHEHRAALAQG
ncbi:MAG TPA: deoxyhypusine synthase [Thermomicrobiales bacterium]|nr:deoxyhypusine synthase [Thermomicrobiales bacterium]